MLIGALVVDSVGNGLFLPLSLIYFTKVTTVPLALIGVLLSIANIMQLPIPVWAGSLADRFGGVPLVIGAQLLQAGGYLASGFARGPLGILLAASMVAIGVRFFWSTVFTVLADYVDSNLAARSKDHWYAWANMSRTGGIGLGGVLTGIAVSGAHTGVGTYRLVAYVSAACFLVAAVTISAFVRVPRLRQTGTEDSGSYRTLARDRRFLSLIGVNTCYALSYTMFALALPTTVIRALHGPIWLSSGLLIGNTLLVSLATAPVIARVRRHRRTRILVASATLWCAWSLVMAVMRPTALGALAPILIGATLMYSAATIMQSPVSAALATEIAPAASRGRYLASFQYSFTFAEMIAPAFFATLFGVAHPLPWLGLAAVNAVSIPAMLALEARLPRASLREPDEVVPQPVG